MWTSLKRQQTGSIEVLAQLYFSCALLSTGWHLLKLKTVMLGAGGSRLVGLR